MKKIFFFVCFLLIISGIFLFYNKKNTIPMLTIEDSKINVESMYIYGTHLNLSGNYEFEQEVELVLYNGEFISYNVNLDDNKFSLSKFINDGVYLDDIPIGDYYLFFRTKYFDNENIKYKYYALDNSTEYKETIYYTMSNYNKKIVISNEDSYPTMMINVSNNTNNDVYDVVIDPGHGGVDGGANNNGYKETDFTMTLAQKIKLQLENYGIKVKLTYEEGELSSNKKLEEYGKNGRAVVPREVNSKYLFSIHLNSSIDKEIQGLEVYTAKNINYDFAKILVNNITSMSGINYSNNKINRIANGIYSRNFTVEDISSSMKNYEEKNLIPYEITTNTSYYYMIRETGGIITGAYVDDRNIEVLGNPYVNSNIGTESYLLELGYISNNNDLSNMINNMDKYVEAIAISIKNLYY